MAENTNWLDVVAFIKVGREQKIKPKRVGYAKRDGDKLYVTLQLMPVPGAGWDGSLVIEKQQEREEDRDDARDSDRRDTRSRDSRDSGRGSRR